MRLKSATLLSLAVIVSTGCAFGRRSEEPQPPNAPITLEIRNNNWADVNVYAIRSGQRARLTTVTATQSVKLILNPEMIGPGGEIRIFAQAIGGYARYTSPRVYAPSGGVVTLELAIDLRRSIISTW